MLQKIVCEAASHLTAGANEGYFVFHRLVYVQLFHFKKTIAAEIF